MIIDEINNFRKKYSLGLLRGGITFGLNALSYLINRKPIRGPLYVGLDITFRCNAKCAYCDRWKKDSDKEITTAEVLRLVRELGKMKSWFLSVGGGEPLLRNDLDKVIREAKRQGLGVNINTNGGLLKSKARMLVDSGTDVITVSVESHLSQVHDKIRNCTGLFKLLSEGIEEVKRIRKNNKPSIKIRMDVNKDNFKDIEAYIKYWTPKVDEIIFQPIHDEPSNFFVTPKSMKFSNADLRDFKIFWGSILKRYPEFSNAYHKEFLTFFFNKKKLYEKYKCYAGYFSVEIDADGNVYPCTAYIKKVGNIKEKSFRRIWNGKEMTDFRKFVRQRKNKCVCWYNCNGTLNCYLTKVFGNK